MGDKEEGGVLEEDSWRSWLEGSTADEERLVLKERSSEVLCGPTGFVVVSCNSEVF